MFYSKYNSNNIQAKYIISIFIICIFTSCVTNKPFYNTKSYDWATLAPDSTKEIEYSIFLIGDSRKINIESGIAKLFKHKIQSAKENSSIIFLGDNVYECGLPDSTDKNFKNAERDLLNQLEMVKNFKGNIYFLPGNHDWNKGKERGYEYLKNQEDYIEKYLNNQNVFLPKGGCPGPVEISLTENIVLIVIDFQWWLYPENRPNNEDCEIQSEEDFILQINDAIRRNSNKKIIFATHNPLYSVGNHGGSFLWKDNIFPLTNINKYLYIPLPGFLYTGFRKYLGDIQDIANPQYKLLRNSLIEILTEKPNIIYACGHEHNLQFVTKNNLHHIISGSASMNTYVARSNKTDFAYSKNGYSVVNFYKNGDVWIEYWVADDNNEGKIVFRKKLYNEPNIDYKEIESKNKLLNYTDSTIYTNISNDYEATPFHKFWLGENYRKEWKQYTKFKYFDINKDKGGLKIIKRGGGMQTKSMRLENEDKKQYVLRSVDKSVDKAIPKKIRNTFAAELVQDQISASHPYAALTIPKLADAINVFHSNPKIVYVPDDPRLGVYRKDMAGKLFLFEERSDGNRDDVYSFGYSKKIISTGKVLSKTKKKSDNKVDQQMVLRSRLFDVLINDWDRHDDQWRWATFKNGDYEIYKPIPRDRDQVFFVNQGVIPWIASKNPALNKIQGFDYDTKDMNGLVYNARFFDRTFLNQMSYNQWQLTADSIKSQLTDKIIEDAIKTMPEEIYKISGETIIAKLKARRDKLPEFARRHYQIIAKTVDITGTAKREYFKVERLNDNETKVTVFSMNKKEEIKEKIYERTFFINETDEIRLFGFENDDKFYVTGNVKKGIKVRLIGGYGDDKFIDDSNVKKGSKKTLIYDTKVSTEINGGKETKNMTSNDMEVNDYDRKEYKPDDKGTIFNLGYNIDDGIFIIGGYQSITYSFRKSPSTKQKGLVSYAYATGAYSFKYRGEFNKVINKNDFVLNIDVDAPEYSNNFFGMGNETKLPSVNVDKNRYNIVRYKQIKANPMIRRKLNKNTSFFAGLSYQYTQVIKSENRFITNMAINGLNDAVFKEKGFVGINASMFYDSRDNDVLPNTGKVYNFDISLNKGVIGNTKNYSQFKTDFIYYFSFKRPHTTVFAFRLGGAFNIGSYEFFQANTLGGTTNLRGYRKTRFTGDATIYQDSEIRFSLFPIRNYLFSGQFGILGFHDIGRVWVKGENSNLWHNGYGGGFWLSPLEMAVISVTYDISSEEKSLSVKFRYLF